MLEAILVFHVVFNVKKALHYGFLRYNVARRAFFNTYFCLLIFRGHFLWPRHKKCGHPWISSWKLHTEDHMKKRSSTT